MGLRYYQIYLVWLVELTNWKTISTDLHSIKVMNWMGNSMLILNFSSRVPTN